MSLTTLSILRTGLFLLFGLLVIGYAIGTLLTGSQIFSGWTLLWAGLALNVILFGAYALSDKSAVHAIWDEHSHALFNRAFFWGYFATVAAIPLLGLGLELDAITTGTAFSSVVGVAIGTPMILFAVFEIAASRA